MSTKEDLQDAIDLDADLKEDGRLVKFVKLENVSDSPDKVLESYTDIGEFYVLPTKASLKPDGETIRVNDKWLMISGIHDISQADRVVDEGIDYSIVNLFPLRLSNQTILNKIQIRL